jgi:ATP-dependent exoDNAse (exonuclease V) beta subunit
MTIHNAKGLEFDTVILPHLERKSPNDDKQLLLWMERPRPGQHNALLIAPIHATGNANDSIYDYIKRQHAIKSDYESARLLYVATTRAKKRLHLFFSLQQDKGKISEPAANSLLDKLWNSIATEIMNKSGSHYHRINYNEQDSVTTEPIVKVIKKINRLSLEWTNPVKELHLADAITYHNKNSGFQLADNNPKYIGIFLHQILQQICLQGVAWWESQPLEQKTNYCRNHLVQLGMLPIHLPMALDRVLSAVQNTLIDPRGQWIIKQHQEAQSELPLTVIIENQVKSLVIDRTFVDESGTRWIIDYKTAVLGDEDNLNDFLSKEKSKYASQLGYYAQAIRELDQRPIQLGLYFPLISAWEAWSFSE